MDETIQGTISELCEEGHNQHIDTGKLLLQSGTVYIYPIDYLAIPTLNRSLNLMHGFCDLIAAKNFIAAAPLIRLQLDNVLRLSAAWIVDDPMDFACKVVTGTPIKNLHDKENKKMTDHYLLQKVAVDEPWIANVYKHTSGYIHLSDKHVYHAISPEKDNQHNFKIAVGDAFVPDAVYVGAIEAFIDITSLLLAYIRGLGEWKRENHHPPKAD
jgi:hypothetical protein